MTNKEANESWIPNWPKYQLSAVLFLLHMLEMTLFNIWVSFERAFGRQPGNHQEETEQKLLSTSSPLVAVETRPVMESRRVGEGRESVLGGGVVAAGSDR